MGKITDEQVRAAKYRDSYKPRPQGFDWPDFHKAVELCGGLHFPPENARTALIKALAESDADVPFDYDFELLEVLCFWRRRKAEIDAASTPVG